MIGGAFTAVNNSSARARLARLFADGSLDSTFFNTGSGVSGIVWCLAVQTDGRIVIGGDFTSVNGTARTRVARLNANGSVDGSFVPTNTIAGSVLALAAQSDNKLVVGGSFSGGNFPSWNVRLNADGTVDSAFSSFPNGAVNAIAIQTDGKIVLGGAFTSVNGAARNRIARLNSDGSLDNTFLNGLAGASAAVRCVQIQPDGKILIGGDFTTVNGTARGSVARLNSNGALDTGFASSPGANGFVYALARQPDSSVVIGGTFSTYAAASLTRVARLYADGTRDTTFTNFGINNIVRALAVQSDGGLLIGGTFTMIENTSRLSLGRLYGNLYPPQFTSQPVSRSTNVGANVTFSAQVSNPTPSNFQWRKDGNNLSGAVGMSYTLYNVQFADAGNYSVFVSNAAGGTTSSNAILNVGLFPTFTSQPSSLTVTQGQSATFSASADGMLSYFWCKNGTPIAGATNTTFTIPAAFGSNAATYTVVVSNFLKSITSTGAVLTVIVPASISVQPANQIVGEGSNTTFTVLAAGTALSYQWFKGSANIPGATAFSYAINNVQFSDQADYTVTVSNILNVVTSDAATLTVRRFPPDILIPPASQAIPVGSNATFTVLATGTTLSYQWRKDETNSLDAVGPELLLANVTLADSGGYSVIVTNPLGSVTSIVAQLNVGYAPVIVLQPVSVTNYPGGTAFFSCTTTGSPPLNLQWLVNGLPAPNQTNTTLTVTNLQHSDFGYYALAATNIFGGTTSSSAMLRNGTIRKWIATGGLLRARTQHTATLLTNGTVLVVGGSNAELYDPATGTWMAAGALANARASHTATLLRDGRVLIAGGYANPVLSSAEVYDPATGSWHVTGTMTTTRYSHNASLLPSGKVLVASGGQQPGVDLRSAELYDPATGTWTATGAMTHGYAYQTATSLLDGKVLVAGISSELYDPATGMWTSTGTMTSSRRGHTAVLLPNGKVLAAGRAVGGYASIAELYDPATSSWAATGFLTVARGLHTATLLPSGETLVVGGQNSTGALSSTELYAAASGTWAVAGALTTARGSHTATLLPDGRVLVVGGQNSTGTLASAELYDKVVAAVYLIGLSHTYDGNAKSVTVTTTPPGLAVDLTYDGSLNAPTNVGNYTVVATIKDLAYQGGTTNTLTIHSPPTPIVLTGASMLTDGSFYLAFTNTSSLTFSVLATTNVALSLSNWAVLGSATETPLGSGQFQFTDPQATNSPQRFYRLRSP